jgi:hypothetical protein
MSHTVVMVAGFAEDGYRWKILFATPHQEGEAIQPHRDKRRTESRD